MGSFEKMPETVYITVPKFVTINSNPSARVVNLTKIKPAPGDITVMKPLISLNTMDMEDDESPAPRGKKRRLDHLTWEEKIQRKKLKNRVAAQTSRDRKKARMEEMESEIKVLTEKSELLQNKCESLQSINDALLEKNRKLDMEVENLRHQLSELKERQTKQQSESDKNKTQNEAGINISNELGVNTSKIEKESNLGGTLEDSCPLPTLQDMLLIDEEFDARKLEELAESLLANITADMESCDKSGNEVFTQTTSGSERLLGSMVGSQTECLESGKYSTEQSQSDCLNNLQTTEIIPATTKTTTSTTISSENKLPLSVSGNETDVTILAPETTTTIAEVPENVSLNTTTLDTVYGTYDSKTNSITIVMDDDSVAVNEAVEEIYCDGETPKSPNDIKFYSPIASPSQVYLNVTDCSMDGTQDHQNYDDDDLNFDDPIERFLIPKSHVGNPLSRSPALSVQSVISDHGYESIIGSPSQLNIPDAFDATSSNDFSWEHSFSELFPTLI